MNFNLSEAKDLGVYKKLLQAVGKYMGQFPASGLNPIFKATVDRKLKILPKDERALMVLNHVLSTGSDAAKVQALLNLTFADMPLDIRPQYNDGRNNMTAYWGKNGKLFDRVLSLLNIDEKDKADGWLDVNREKVKLVPDFKEEPVKEAVETVDDEIKRLEDELKSSTTDNRKQALTKRIDQMKAQKSGMQESFYNDEGRKKIADLIHRHIIGENPLSEEETKFLDENQPNWRKVFEGKLYDPTKLPETQIQSLVEGDSTEDFKYGDRVEVNGNKEAIIIDKAKVPGMYDVRMWSGKRHVGDVCVSAKEIKRLGESKLVEGDGTEFNESEEYSSEMGVEEAQMNLQEAERFLIGLAKDENNQEDPLVKAASLVLQAENILSDYVSQQGGM